MRKRLPLLPLAFALSVVATLTGCGGSGGGGSDDNNLIVNNGGGSSEPPAPDPFSIDSYTEYTDGNDLSGIWMMVVTSDYDASSDSGIRHASESLRSVVFIKEHDNGSYSSIDVSDPFCETYSYINADYAGSIVEISTQYTQLELVVSANSRMNGTLGFTGFCPTGNCFDNRKSSRIVDMIKVAPLPIGNWRDNFQYEAPAIGHISGVVQPDQPRDATSDALEFDDDVTCFMHSKGIGGRDFLVAPTTAFNLTPAPDYESIVVSTKEKDFIAGRTNDVLGYWGASVYEYRPTQSTKKFNMNVSGTKPITAHISADASNDASSDGAEIDIKIDI